VGGGGGEGGGGRRKRTSKEFGTLRKGTVLAGEERSSFYLSLMRGA